MPLEYSLQHRGQFSDPSPWNDLTPVPIQQFKSLGIDSLPKQRCVRAIQKPFVFNVMVVGESGLGKTTFINTFFHSDLKDLDEIRELQKTTKVETRPIRFQLEENGVTLNLTVVDTPGFGDQLNRKENLDPILEFIEQQYQRYLEDEKSSEMREFIDDTRIHALLYFISPGNGLRQLDINALKLLSEKVNVIPVIAKSDTIMPNESQRLKSKIMSSIKKHDIKIYPNDNCLDSELTEKHRSNLPYCVMGSMQTHKVGDKIVRGRKYKWGVAVVEDKKHCDFEELKEMLMHECLLDLVESTHNRHYFLHRQIVLRKDGRPESILECDEGFESRLENRKLKFSEDMVNKESEMRKKFVQQVKDKENELKEKEAQLQNKGKELMEEIELEKRQIEAEERELDALLAQRNASPGGSMNKKIFGKK